MILGYITITAGASDAGGYNAKQLALLGIAWPPPPREVWILEMIGKEISDETYQRFLALRGMTKKRERKQEKQIEFPLPEPEPSKNRDLTEFKRWARGAYQRGEKTILELIDLQRERFGNPFAL